MKAIPGVPASITREQYVSLTSAVGLDPKDLRKLEFRLDGIYADVIERDADGRLVIDGQRDEVVVNRVYIPVVG